MPDVYKWQHPVLKMFSKDTPSGRTLYGNIEKHEVKVRLIMLLNAADEKLSKKRLIKQVCRKTMKSICIFSRVRHFINHSCMLKLYYV